MEIEASAGFKRLTLLTIVFIYLVILAGGIVRGTGSGMGCPDWPRCFGQWVPPTHISQLPINYKEKFKVGHRIIADFNAFKTWVEYTNRLLGVLVGILVFAVFIASVPYFKSSPAITYLSGGVFFLTGFQGWIGAKVVSSHLAQHMITIHMLIALVIVALVLLLFHKVSEHKDETKSVQGQIILVLAVLTLGQVLLGTQIRQEIDTIAIRYNDQHRELWIQELGSNLIIHRIIAGIIVVLNTAYTLFVIKKAGLEATISKLMVAILVVFVAEYISGISMVRLEIPYLIQPVHLLLASTVFGLQIYAWLLARPQKQINREGSLAIH